jgi:hypothetical protein
MVAVNLVQLTGVARLVQIFKPRRVDGAKNASVINENGKIGNHHAKMLADRREHFFNDFPAAFPGQLVQMDLFCHLLPCSISQWGNPVR